MKKIPTLFERTYVNHEVAAVNPVPYPGTECVLQGEGIATVKWDGACCLIRDGMLYKRYDAKHGKPVPENAITCQPEPDPVTGHMPCWRPCRRNAREDIWFWDAFDRSGYTQDGTYEAIGPHFQANPYRLEYDYLVPHGKDILTDVPRDFEGIWDYLFHHDIEGIVFWKDGKPLCKIKNKDFGRNWRENPILPKHLVNPDMTKSEVETGPSDEEP